MADEQAVPTAEQIDAEWMDILESAEEEQSAAFERLQFGKLAIAPRYLKWVDVDGKRKPREITVSEYGSTPDRQRSLELVFDVNIQEFNPQLEWTYQRKVGVGSQDWREILKPSVEEVLGEGSMEGDQMGATLGQLRGKYVRISDVPQSKIKGDKIYRTVSLQAVFENRDACYSEWYEIYGSSLAESEDGSPEAELAAPGGWEAEWAEWDLAEVAEEAPEQVEEYGSIEGAATDYYGVSKESLIKALAAGGMKNAQIAKLEDGLTPAAVKKIVA